MLKRVQLLATLSGTLLLSGQIAPAASAATPRTVVIGVDYSDPTNQDPALNRVFEYTDFFGRRVQVHRGDTLDFRTAPGALHFVALARDEQDARQTFPVVSLDKDDPIAVGSQHQKIVLGPSNGPITGGNIKTGTGTVGGINDAPTCGLVQMGESPCTYTGGDDLESAGGVFGADAQGNPVYLDWNVSINAPAGEYTYFCFIHPGMRGTLQVVDRDDATTSQAQIDKASAAQFAADRAAALEAERDANVVRFRGGAPGTRTYDVSVGLAAADNHVAVDEMLPRDLRITQGDRVAYHWRDPHGVHTVSFPAGGAGLPGPFVTDSAPSAEPSEMIGDPGTSAPGTVLSDPNAVVDSGLLIGTAYHVQPTVQTWGVATNRTTAPGTYAYQCTVHDWMVGGLEITK